MVEVGAGAQEALRTGPNTGAAAVALSRVRRLGAEPGPVDVRRAQAGFWKPCSSLGCRPIVLPPFEAEQEPVAGLGAEVGETKLGELLSRGLFSVKIAFESMSR